MKTPRTKKVTQPQAPAAAPARDETAERLIEAGLVPNNYILDLNGSLRVPYTMELPAPWNLPSRLFQFPVVVSRCAEDGSRRLALRHPLMADHPFVQQVATVIGRPLGVTGAYGWESVGTGQWHHAVDLVSEGLWRDLLATAAFTTPQDIARAVVYGLDYSAREGERKGRGYLTIAEAREIMRALGSAEPGSRSDVIGLFQTPSPCRQDGGRVTWPINDQLQGHNGYARAWGRIIGIEAGWLPIAGTGS